MTTAPRVSVVMNCYNGEAYLEEALQSVLAQTFEDWEIVFWDNQSTDQTADIFQGIRDTRLRYFRAEAHTSLGDARNRAVAQARGGWLAFLDSDDRWMPDKLATQLREAETDPDVGLVYGPVKLEIERGLAAPDTMERFYLRFSTPPHGPRNIFEDLLEKNFIIFSTLILRRDLFDRVGGINARLSQNEDYDLLLKASRIEKAICVASACAVYRIHATNASHGQIALNFEENFDIFDSLPAHKAIARARRINATRYAVYKLRRGQIGPGLSLLMREGSASWALKRAAERILQRLSGGSGK